MPAFRQTFLSAQNFTASFKQLLPQTIFGDGRRLNENGAQYRANNGSNTLAVFKHSKHLC